jgi:membrane protease YdiL (CAAX protease family)
MKNSRTFMLSTTEALIASAIALIACILWLASREVSIPSAFISSICAAMVLGSLLILGIREHLESLQQALKDQPAGIFVAIFSLWGLYALYMAGTGAVTIQPIIAMAVYLSLPFLLLKGSRGLQRSTWLDAVNILWIWLPIEFGLMRRFVGTSGTHNDFQYAFAQGLAINMGLIAFAAWRRFPGIGYRFEFDKKGLSTALTSFLLFALIAIPLGLAIGFIQYSFEYSKLLSAPAAFLGIFLTIAIPEELLFRGLIQNWLERVSGRPNWSLMLASIIFGAAHLNNGPAVPNYQYFLMASIAGVFYGLVWKRTGNIAASAITHALVDTVWRAAFR